MYQITVEKSFSAAHTLPDHPGKCRNLHGHNWDVRVTLGGHTTPPASTNRAWSSTFPC